MISRCGLMTKKDGMSKADFQDYWLNVHGPIAAKMTSMRQYEQHVFWPVQMETGFPSGPIAIDGYSELQFDSYGDMLNGVESLHGQGAQDVPLFANPYTPIIVMAKRPVVRVPAYLQGRSLLKLVAFLGRAKGISSQAFHDEWWNVFASQVATVPGFVGYSQDIIIDRVSAGQPLSYGELPVDGVAELWFESQEAFDEFCSSPELARVMSHAHGFIGTVDAFFAKTYPVDLQPA